MNMKNSDISWVGKIPESWQIQRIKNLFDLRDEKNYLPLEQVNLISLYTDKGVLQHNDIEKTTGNKAVTADGYKKVFRGDIIVNIILCWMGAIGRSDYEGVTSPAYDVYKPNNNVESRFYHYYFRTTGFSGDCYIRGRGIMAMRWRTYSSQFRDIKVVVPPLDIQKRIVQYLDRVCGEIDLLCSKTESSIIEYQKLKHTIIRNAVVKGIRKEVLMKDSGIKWIGSVPDNWDVTALKRSFKIYAGATPKSDKEDYWNGNITWITPADYKTEDKYVSYGRKNLTEEGYYSCGTTVVPAGSIIFSKRAPVGTVAISSEELCTNQGCLSCVPLKSTDSKYFYYTMSVFTEQFELFSSGTTFKEISMDNFSNFFLPKPPIDEQIEIADFLDIQVEKIDELINKKKKFVNEIREYKKVLIYEYITGKKEVI